MDLQRVLDSKSRQQQDFLLCLRRKKKKKKCQFPFKEQNAACLPKVGDITALSVRSCNSRDTIKKYSSLRISTAKSVKNLPVLFGILMCCSTSGFFLLFFFSFQKENSMGNLLSH